jgi:hypothetical protein
VVPFVALKRDEKDEKLVIPNIGQVCFWSVVGHIA